MCTAWGCSGATWVGLTEAAAAHEKVSAYNGGDVTNSSLCILLARRDDLWCDLWETDRHLPLPYLASNPHTIYGRFMMSWKKGREKKNRGSLINNQRNGDSWHDKGQQSHPRLHTRRLAHQPGSQYYVCTADADNILSNYPLNTSKGKHSHATKFAVQCNVVCQPRIFLTWPSMANRRSSKQLEPNSSRQIATQSKHPLAPHNVHSKTLGGFFLPLRDVSHQKLARLGKKMVIYGHSLPPPLSREDQSNRLYLISDFSAGRKQRTTYDGTD